MSGIGTGRHVVVLVAAASAGMALVVAGSGDLAAPSLSWDDAARWYDEVGPAVATMTVVRLAAVGLAAWLTVAAALQTLADLVRFDGLRRAADVVSPAMLRGAAGASLSAALVVPLQVVPEAPPPASGESIAVMTRLSSGEPTMSTSTTSTTVPGSTTTTAPDSPPPTGTVQPTTPPSLPARPGEAAHAPQAEPSDDTYVVEPGESFWSIAEDTVSEHLAQPATDDEVLPYWRSLIEANADRLVAPDVPDLLYAGQHLLLPPVP